MALTPDYTRYSSWLEWRRRLRVVPDAQLDQEPKRLGDDVHDLAINAALAQTGSADTETQPDVADSVSILLCGVANLDPLNPMWPGRDRVLVDESSDLLMFAAALARMGFFSPGELAMTMEKAGREDDFGLPGLEVVRGRGTLSLAWELSIEARLEKERWLAAGLDISWADPNWRNTPVGWRVFCWSSWRDPALDWACELPQRSDEPGAGLSTIITAPYEEGVRMAESWREMGWDAYVVSREDRHGMYRTLSVVPELQPMAVFVGAGDIHNAAHRERADTKMLGEMTDEQFHAVMGEFFDL